MPPVEADGDRRDLWLLLRVDDAELPVHDLDRLVGRALDALFMCTRSAYCLWNDVRANGPWLYKLSRLYQEPDVTAAVERITAEAQAKKAA